MKQVDQELSPPWMAGQLLLLAEIRAEAEQEAEKEAERKRKAGS